MVRHLKKSQEKEAPKKRGARQIETRTSFSKGNIQEEEIGDLDQEGERVIEYNPSPREIIDVDVEGPETPITKIVKELKQAYGNSFDVYSGTAVFLKYLLDDENTYHQKLPVSASNTQDEKYLNQIGPFTVIALFYLRTLATSHLFAALALRNLPTNSKGCVFHGITLLNKSRFRLCYLSPRHQDRSYKKFLILRN